MNNPRHPYFSRPIVQMGLTVFSAIVFALALPNEILQSGSLFLGLFGLTPFFIALRFAGSHRAAGRLGALFGLVNSCLTNFWLLYFADFAVWTLGGTTLGYILFLTLAGRYLFWALQQPKAWRALVAAAVWSVYEYAKSNGFLGYPWGLSAYPAHRYLPLIQIAEITGVYGISLLMSLINLTIAETLLQEMTRRQRRNLAGTTLLLLLLTLSFGWIRMAIPIPFENTMRCLLVQVNEDPWRSDSYRESIERAIETNRAGLEGTRPDIVAWSETAIPYPVIRYYDNFYNFPLKDPLFDLIKDSEAYFLTGTPIEGEREGEWLNGSILLSPEAEILGTYGKMHPVPFAEYIPFWEYEAVRNFFRETVGLSSTWTIGSRRFLYTLPLRDGGETIFGTPICFEDAFPEVCSPMIREGADFLFNLTNDSWSKTVSSEMQHHLAALFRSVESKRLMIRSTNGGITSIIGPYGNLIEELPPFTRDTLYAEVPVYKEARFTPYIQWGDLFVYLLVTILLGLIVYQRVKKFKRI